MVLGVWQFLRSEVPLFRFWEHMVAALARANGASPLNNDATHHNDDATLMNDTATPHNDATPITAARQPGAAGVGEAVGVARSVRQKR